MTPHGLTDELNGSPHRAICKLKTLPFKLLRFRCRKLFPSSVSVRTIWGSRGGLKCYIVNKQVAIKAGIVLDSDLERDRLSLKCAQIHDSLYPTARILARAHIVLIDR